MENKLYLVIPCYNEEEVLPETSKRLKEKVTSLITKGKIDEGSRIVFVNDGSKDRTWELISELHKQDPMFSGINLSRNRGHQNALLAGLMTVKDHADMVISMDADLQDDIDAVDEMVEKYLNGVDIVYGVRSSRAKDTFFKFQNLLLYLTDNKFKLFIRFSCWILETPVIIKSSPDKRAANITSHRNCYINLRNL